MGSAVDMISSPVDEDEHQEMRACRRLDAIIGTTRWATRFCTYGDAARRLTARRITQYHTGWQRRLHEFYHLHPTLRPKSVEVGIA